MSIGTLLLASAVLASRNRSSDGLLQRWSAVSPVPDGLVAFNSTEGAALLLSPTATRTSFFQTVQNLENQKTQSLCGAATAVTMRKRFSPFSVAAVESPVFGRTPNTHITHP